MEVEFTLEAEADLKYWKKVNNTAVLKRIRSLIEAIQQTPFDGQGKPEALKYNLKGCWSRRITKEHRMVYEIISNKIYIHSLRGHY